jgi:hypothetical protein
MLRSFVLSLLLTAVISPLFSQSADDLTGTWTVKNVIVPNDPDPARQKKWKMIISSFEKSIFQFRPDKTFVFDCAIKEICIKDAKWSYDQLKKLVSVTGKDPKGNTGPLMGIKVKMQDAIYYFEMEETPVILEMNKKTLPSK